MYEMTRALARAAVCLRRAGQRVYLRKWRFLVIFVLAFALTFAVLSLLGLTPDAPVATPDVVVSSSSSLDATTASAPETPIKIAIPAIALSVSVSDPVSTNTDILDAALLSGAVRYPTSALLGETGRRYLRALKLSAHRAQSGVQDL